MGGVYQIKYDQRYEIITATCSPKIPMEKFMTVFEKHQLAIAKKTLKMSDVGARIMGGMTKAQAKEIINRLKRKA